MSAGDDGLITLQSNHASRSIQCFSTKMNASRKTTLNMMKLKIVTENINKQSLNFNF